jgi:hypothetical protein
MQVQASGVVREIDDPQEVEDIKKTVLQSLAHYKNFWWPILAAKGADYVSYKIQTEWLRVLDLSNTTPERQQRYFEISL